MMVRSEALFMALILVKVSQKNTKNIFMHIHFTQMHMYIYIQRFSLCFVFLKPLLMTEGLLVAFQQIKKHDLNKTLYNLGINLYS